MKCYLLFLLILLANFNYAQETTNDRMKRDIEVAENILATLLNQNAGFRFYNNVEGTYIEGHGAMFTIAGSNGVFGYSLNGTNLSTVSILAPSQNNKVQIVEKELNLDSLNAATTGSIKEVMKIFITDYAQLLSQLQPNEKILLRYGSRIASSSNVLTLSRASIFTTDGDELMPKELTAELSKAAIDDFRAGKLTKAQLEERIKFTEQSAGGKRETDLELLSSIFNRLYQGDLSETFRLYSNPSYEKIEGLGVIFNMNFAYRGWDSGFRLYGDDPRETIRKRIDNVVDSVRTEQARVNYPKFLEDFKQNIIEYARTIKSLDTSQILVFKLSLPKCKDCEIAEAVELSVKKSVLEEYDKNKITLAQAVEKITVRETRND